MFRTLERYEEGGLGLPYPVTLINGAEEQLDDKTGERVGLSIPSMETLVAAVAIARASIPFRLAPEEVRFIRHVIGMPSKEFAVALDLEPATYSRWENGRQEVGGWADKQVRLGAIVMLADRVPGLSVDRQHIFKMAVQSRPAGWVPQIEMELRHIRPETTSEEEAPQEEWDFTPMMAA